MLPPFVLSFGLIGLVVAWVAALIGTAVANAAKSLSGDGDETQQPFSRSEYASNARESADWEARQKAIRQQRQQTEPDSNKE